MRLPILFSSALCLFGWLIGLESTSVTAFPQEPRDQKYDEFESSVRPFLKRHCQACHGESVQKAEFTVKGIGPVMAGEDILRWEKILEMVQLGDMPPEGRPRPDREHQKKVTRWISRELGEIGRGHDEGKLALPHQANRLNHEELFSGEHLGPASSRSRLWRKNEHIYERFAAHVKAKLSQPFLGLGGRGIQDYDSLIADEATIKTMLRNSTLVAAALIEGKRSPIARVLAVGAKVKREELERAMDWVFRQIFERRPTQEDRARYIEGLYRKTQVSCGERIAFETMIRAMLLSPEFVFRMELGLGEKLDDGRRFLAPMEMAYALSYAIFDRVDSRLLEAATQGRLRGREDARRELRKVLESEDERKRYWHYPMYHRWGADYYAHQPRVLRFFREFFGYGAVTDVFKDRERNPDHHALRLRKDADLLVLSVLERDRDVLAELLTTSRYPIDYFEQDRLKRILENPEDRLATHLRGKYGDEEFEKILDARLWPGIESRHANAYDLPREKADELRRRPGDLIELDPSKRAGMLTHPAWLVAHSGNFDTDPIRRGKWIRERLLADLVPDIPIGVDARVPEDPQRTLRERLSIVEAPECWRCHKQMNPLGITFEGYDDFGRSREHIVLGDADRFARELRRWNERRRRLLQDLKKWQALDAAGRAEKRAHAEAELQRLVKPGEGERNFPEKLRKYENARRRWTRELETFSAMTDEDQARRVAEVRRKLHELERPVPDHTKPVDARGELRGTGDPELDGPVLDAIDLVHRLARSERVRQSFVRHVFRYWIGRNETYDDSPTLIAADRAYVESGGSFKALLLSLLTSDSFLLRRH